jgi:hypothetical protein
VLVDALADGGEGGSEVEHVLVLGLVASLAPVGVIAGLLAAAGVATGGLQVAVGEGADPDAFPGGRDDEGLDAGEGVLVFRVTDTEGFVVGGAVGEAGAGAVAGDAGARVVDVAKAGGARGVECRPFLILAADASWAAASASVGLSSLATLSPSKYTVTRRESTWRVRPFLR